MVTVLRLLTALLSMSCWKEISGLQMITQPNKTTISFIGSNQTFAWNFILTEEDKAKELKVTFAHWSNEYNMIEGDHMVTFVRKPTGNEAVYKGSLSIAKRFHWVGDMARGFVAFQLINVQAKDASDYGIRFRVDGFPPDTDESGFTLSVRDLPPSPPEPANITVRIVEGKTLNITCRARMESESSFVLWLKDNWPIKRGRKKFLFIQSIKRSQAGDYMCVSLSQDGNHSSPFTVVDVLFAPKILKPNKQVSMELTRGNSTTLKCTASANPYPALTWHTQGGEIKQGVSNTLNSSSLIVTPRNDSDFTSYMCIAKNGIGFDSVTFMLNEKAFRTTDHAKPKKTHEGATPGNHDKDTLTKYLSITAALAVITIFAFLIQRYVAKRSRGQTNQRGCEEADESHIGSLQSNELVRHGAYNLSFSGDPEWEIPRTRLNVEKVIGRGAFGVVSRGLALDLPGKPGWTVVAVKSVQEDASEKEKLDLLSEMSVLKHLDPHPHVINLYGCVTTEAQPLVVVEYAQYGDLLGYVRKSRGVRDNYYSDPSVEPRTNLTSKQLLRFAWQISDGMDYLSKRKIIHRDLAARNVLVGDEDVCKITDFGMARDVWEEDIYVRTHEGRLPIKWTAPEALFGNGSYTTQSDV
ncbi:fibroblast growth factor receptor 3-like [Stylophora pistillata]|uniref:fibroblast growth factor receptor 3-like n=1 Tax=Stylophora pistillata TaxID=50429 RepID=UPI000C04D427|nr:fibroblast growth factor receptor 3-like [Stylophora pistillata]